MTTKERLHQLVVELPDSAAEDAERLLDRLKEPSERLPTSAQMGGSVPDLRGEMSAAEYLLKVRTG